MASSEAGPEGRRRDVARLHELVWEAGLVAPQCVRIAAHEEMTERRETANYRARVRAGDRFDGFAFTPERPARTITVLVRLTASRRT